MPRGIPLDKRTWVPKIMTRSSLSLGRSECQEPSQPVICYRAQLDRAQTDHAVHIRSPWTPCDDSSESQAFSLQHL